MSGYDFTGLAGFPLGPKRRGLLRRVYLASGGYRCQRNVDREIVGGCVELGLIRRDTRDDQVLLITDMGRAYHEQLARAV